MTFVPRPFRPARWAPGPHLQTLGARVLRPAHAPPMRRERVTTPDGDFLDLDWALEAPNDAPVVLVLHGLEGSTRRRYVTHACQQLVDAGLLPVAMNLRGCSGEPNRALHFYHSGKTDDPAWVLRTIRERFPGRPVGALGFSLGGNLLLKLMGERDDGGLGLLDAAVAISVPYDLAAGSALLERSLMGRFYTAYFLRSLKRKLLAKAERLATVIDLEAARRTPTIWEFDEHVTAPLHGFAGAREYYAESSSVRYLAGVRTPTLMLHAIDDPFLPAAAIPRRESEGNRYLQLVVSARGGHVGFLEGASPSRPSFWGEVEAARFLAERLRGTPLRDS